MLVLTGINYANKETLYEEAKTSLKNSKEIFQREKLALNLAENEEALLAAGYSKQYRGKTGRSEKKEL